MIPEKFDESLVLLRHRAGRTTQDSRRQDQDPEGQIHEPTLRSRARGASGTELARLPSVQLLQEHLRREDDEERMKREIEKLQQANSSLLRVCIAELKSARLRAKT